MGRSLRVISLLLAAVILLCGFVPFAEKVLSRCRRVMPVVRQQLSVTLDGRPGKLTIASPGKHFIQFSDGTKLADPGFSSLAPGVQPQPTAASGRAGSFLALWRYLDFHSPGRPDDLAELLTRCGIDKERRGWVRLDGEGDVLGVTVGAFGESEADFPQAWFDKVTSRLVRLTLPDGSSAVLSELGSDAVPTRISLNRGGGELIIFPTNAQKRK